MADLDYEEIMGGRDLDGEISDVIKADLSGYDGPSAVEDESEDESEQEDEEAEVELGDADTDDGEEGTFSLFVLCRNFVSKLISHLQSLCCWCISEAEGSGDDDDDDEEQDDQEEAQGGDDNDNEGEDDDEGQ